MVLCHLQAIAKLRSGPVLVLCCHSVLHHAASHLAHATVGASMARPCMEAHPRSRSGSAPICSLIGIASKLSGRYSCLSCRGRRGLEVLQACAQLLMREIGTESLASGLEVTVQVRCHSNSLAWQQQLRIHRCAVDLRC